MRGKVSAGAYFGSAVAFVGFALTFAIAGTTLRFVTLAAVSALLAVICFFGAWKRYYSRETDLDAPYLYRENIALRKRIHDLEQFAQPRSLHIRQYQAIATTCRVGLENLQRELLADGWSEKDASQTLAIKLVSIGAETETLSYRRDFAEAFAAGGFSISFAQWPSAGTPEYDQFRNTVALVRGDPRNVVRPFVLDALRTADLTITEIDYLPPTRGASISQHDSTAQVAATVVIGPRDAPVLKTAG